MTARMYHTNKKWMTTSSSLFLKSEKYIYIQKKIQEKKANIYDKSPKSEKQAAVGFLPPGPSQLHQNFLSSVKTFFFFLPFVFPAFLRHVEKFPSKHFKSEHFPSRVIIFYRNATRRPYKAGASTTRLSLIGFEKLQWKVFSTRISVEEPSFLFSFLFFSKKKKKRKNEKTLPSAALHKQIPQKY